MRMLHVEIIVVGKELLTGQTQDTNSYWLARQVSSLGGSVRRIVVVDDEEAAIAAEIRTGVANGARVIFTAGGLGPTFDDRTLAGIARATDRALEPDPQALRFVQERYVHFKRQGAVDTAELYPTRQKMACLPLGAEMLANPVGAAPGAWLEVQRTVIISLPGVPRELKAIFQEHLVPRLAVLFGPAFQMERTIRAPLKDESVLTQILDEVRRQIPSVHLKSKPKTFGPEVEMEVCLTAWGEDRRQVEADLDGAVVEIRKRLPAGL